MSSDKCCLLIALCVLVVLLVPQCAAATDEYYTAAVAEFRPLLQGNSSQMLADNLAGYLELIAATNQSTDIIVFPEASLNSLLQLTAVPAPSQLSLCGDTFSNSSDVADFLRQLACAARHAHTYLVINVKEREQCNRDNDNDSDCPTRGYRLYNTNVVLDRRGAVASRYRKWNLYLEAQLNRTAKPEYAIFETDFNVTFGHFVCFDLLFYTPAQELVDRYKLRHLIVTKMFNSELPFLTGEQSLIGLLTKPAYRLTLSSHLTPAIDRLIALINKKSWRSMIFGLFLLKFEDLIMSNFYGSRQAAATCAVCWSIYIIFSI